MIKKIISEVLNKRAETLKKQRLSRECTAASREKIKKDFAEAQAKIEKQRGKMDDYST